MYRDFRQKPLIGRLSLNGILALAGVLGPFVLVITNLIAAFSTPGYRLIQHSISSLALTRLGWIQTIGFLALGLFTEVFVAGLFFSIRGVRGFGFAAALLVCFGFGMLLVGAFRTDLPGQPHTVEGTIHIVAATTTFWIFPVAVLLMVPSLRKDRYWRRLAIYTVIASIIALVLLVAKFWLPDELSWFGLYERMLVANEVIWVEVMALWLLRLSIRRVKGPKPADMVTKPIAP